MLNQRDLDPVRVQHWAPAPNTRTRFAGLCVNPWSAVSSGNVGCAIVVLALLNLISKIPESQDHVRGKTTNATPWVESEEAIKRG